MKSNIHYYSIKARHSAATFNKVHYSENPDSRTQSMDTDTVAINTVVKQNSWFSLCNSKGTPCHSKCYLSACTTKILPEHLQVWRSCYSMQSPRYIFYMSTHKFLP